ncbi:MAG: FHA domain-containing protein [Bradymonadaceae bacterium]
MSAYVDLDVLRGWREIHHDELRAEHVLGALARLVHLDRDGSRLGSQPIHGPDVLVGRFHAQYAPVDVLFVGLRDFESYKMGAPHVHLLREPGGQWFLRSLSPMAHTWHNGTLVEHVKNRQLLKSGDNLRLGSTRFVFETEATGFEGWKARRKELLKEASRVSLYLMRHGAICGPFFELDDARPSVLGRTFPGPRELPGTHHWPENEAVDWDLAGLSDQERKFIAFRHVKVWFSEAGQWMVEPLSDRQRTFINRMAISGPTALQSGDELGLGSILFHFHHPSRTVMPRSKELHVPPVVDWDEGHPPSVKDDEGMP